MVDDKTGEGNIVFATMGWSLLILLIIKMKIVILDIGGYWGEGSLVSIMLGGGGGEFL